MRKRLTKWRLIPLLAVLTLVLAGCGEPFLSTLQPAGEVADIQYDLMVLSTLIMVVVIAVVVVIFIYVVLRFRRRKGEENNIPVQVEGNHKLEIIWTVIPILLLIVLTVPVVTATFKLAEVDAIEDENRKPEEAIVVNVKANLYWWEFEYPDYGIVTSQDLIVPTDEKVYFNLISSDVKHSFWIPAIGGKMDTNTENVNKMWLEFDSDRMDQVDPTGYFYGKCAELCGPSHGLMDFKVKPLPRAEFDQWISDMEGAKVVATSDVAKQGEQLFEEKGCIACHAVSPTDERPAAARTAPNLATFGERARVAGILEHNEENVRAWLNDPETLKPGNKMTGTYPKLSDQELDALTEYLMELKVSNK
ncbi:MULTISPECIES: cytochrome c oxidase subunit II [Metabacillus]|jgi:cytochrome c oxidase subunit 2|uniref:Cytochrome c oxidase subunit 2 n=1 Tax=Metabacillus rhizolycopersici TaxID=2875709 RepID=A0ABS7UKA2_9BACI|nr:MULTISPECIES: cytochrome c oxidase subunit II [Metabacillus]MBZ5748745.1 cytochrome c oxidase subunit II [Metabacillus rhizolycopersici]MCM3652783.1 cytochrome c oxidase subunit II [Metabacillus litoralis]